MQDPQQNSRPPKPLGILRHEEQRKSSRRQCIGDIAKGKDAGFSESLQFFFSIVLRDFSYLACVEVELLPLEGEDVPVGYYDIVENEKGAMVPRIYFQFGDQDLLKSIIRKRFRAIEMNAELLAIDSKSVTPELLQLFIIGHELGHAHDFIVNYQANSGSDGWEAAQQMKQKKQEALHMLPAQNMSPRQLADAIESCSCLDEVAAAVPSICDHPRSEEILSLKHLLEIHEEEYRYSSPERCADKFAAKIIRENAESLGFTDLFS